MSAKRAFGARGEAPSSAKRAIGLVVVLAAGVPFLARAESTGIGLGVTDLGQVQVEEGANGSRSRIFNLLVPHVDVRIPTQVVRFEVSYDPLIYTPIQGWGDPNASVWHVGNARLTALLLRGVTLEVRDSLSATPLQIGAPFDSQENLAATNRATASLAVLRRTRRLALQLEGAAQRFDAFDTRVDEADVDQNGVMDRTEDLNGNGLLDTGLRPGFFELAAHGKAWRVVTKTFRMGLVSGVESRAFDDLPRQNYVAVSGGVAAERRVTSSVVWHLEADTKAYSFASGDSLLAYDTSGTLSWQLARSMDLAVSGSARRTVDVYAIRADMADLAVEWTRDLGRWATLQVGSRYTRIRTLGASPGLRNLDSIVLRTELGVPLRSNRIRARLGYRLWRGGSPGVQWTDDHLGYLGVTWE